MFLVDDLLLGPGKGALLVFKELARKAQEDWLDDDSIKQELQEIYALAEAGKISSQEFEARECRLLERLEQIARMRFAEKWSHADESAVIDAEVTAKPLPAMTTDAPMETLQIETTPVIDTPSMIGAPDVVSTPLFEPAPRLSLYEPPQAPPLLLAPQAPQAPQAPLAPQAPQAPQAPVAPQAPSTVLSIGQVVESAKRALALLGLKVSVISSVSPEESGWRVTAELVERRGIPDTNDLIGVYEMHLDSAGSVLRYERTRLRRRADLGQ